MMVTIEYLVEPKDVGSFVQAMAPMRRIRRRDGATSWGLYQDAAKPGTMAEIFVVESWLEHLRQHDRVSRADRVDQDAARSFHRSAEAPVVRHWITPK